MDRQKTLRMRPPGRFFSPLLSLPSFFLFFFRFFVVFFTSEKLLMSDRTRGSVGGSDIAVGVRARVGVDPTVEI